MFIPYSDNNPLEKFPYVNLGLIGLNVVVFIYCITSGDYEGIIQSHGYHASEPGFLAMLTSAFLHAGLGHLIGNMWFLWIFGDNVEDRLGHVLYLLFYLSSAVAAAILQTLLTWGSGVDIPMVGASGAVSGVLAMYMVLYPWAKVNFFYWFYIVFYGVVQIPAVFVIGVWVLFQAGMAILTQGQQGGVAYWAHLGGFGLGLVVATILRLTQTLSRPRDVQLQGSPKFRQAMMEPEEYTAVPNQPAPLRNKVREGLQVRRTSVQQDQLVKARLLLVRVIAENDPIRLVKYYSLFERKWPAEALPEQQQWEAAQLLQKAGQDALALEAFRKIVDQYPEGSYWPAACLQAAKIYHLHHNYQRARQHLNLLLKERPASPEAEEARNELDRIEKTLSATTVNTGETGGSYLILRQTFDRINTARVGDIIADATGALPLDTRGQVARGQGLLADGLTQGQAESLAKNLQQERVPVLTVSEKQLLVYPEVIEMRVAEFGDEEALFQTYDKEIRILWSNLWLISCARVRVQRSRQSITSVNMPATGMGGGRLYASYSPTHTTTETRRIRVLDIFCSEPLVHLRIREDQFTYRCLSDSGKELSAMNNFTTLVKDLIHRSPCSHVGPGVDRLLSEENFSGLTFQSWQILNRYHFWLVQLCHLQPQVVEGE